MAHPEPHPKEKPRRRTEDKDDATWIVLLVVFGLMGLGGPLLALFLFWLI